MGFLVGLVALISQNDVFSTRHATGALWNLVVDNHLAKLFLVNDKSFCQKLVELFSHSDIQVLRAIASALKALSRIQTAQVSKHALGLASEMCCKNIEVKELFCDDQRMVQMRLRGSCTCSFLPKRSNCSNPLLRRTMGPATQQGRQHAPQACRNVFLVILPFIFYRNPKLRSCCLLICNVLANSPANKSLALKHGLFDVVYTLYTCIAL